VTIEDEIQEICKRLVAGNGEEAALGALARRLRDLHHQFVEDARRNIRILPLLDNAAKRKKAA